MKLKAFRELLLKKSNDAITDKIVNSVSEELLSSMVIESLEKMAKMRAKGPAAALAEEHAAEHSIDPDITSLPNNMLHAIGHHIAGYRKAQENGSQALANHHAKMYGRYMKLGESIKNHLADQGDNSFNFESISPRPWQFQLRHGDHNQDRSQISFDKQKLKDVPGWKQDHKGYDWLQLSPHSEHKDHSDVTGKGHNSNYPMEAVSINGKPVTVPSSIEERDHPMDFHPAVTHVHKSNAALSALDLDKEHADFHSNYGEKISNLKPHENSKEESKEPSIEELLKL